MTELNELELQEAYLKLMRDSEVDKLELALNEPNIFAILSIGHMEIRHSNFLGWLLDPKESHGLNDMFLKRFLREIFFDGKIKELQPVDAERLDYQNVEIRREWRNIDLLIKFPNLIICIENKIWSKDHSEQLTKYKKVILEKYPEHEIKKVFVYLTPYGSSSSHEQEEYAFISYKHILQILERILTVYRHLIGPQSSFYIQDYIKSLKQNLMGSDITNEMARKIYLNHKKLLDFIYSNRPDQSEEFINLLEIFLKKRGFVLGSKAKNFVRFQTAELQSIVPRYNKIKTGWSKREAFLFELQILDRSVLELKVTSSPAGSNSSFKNRLNDIMSELDGAARLNDNGWQVFFSKKADLKIKDHMNINPKKRPPAFDAFWENEVLPIIHKVEEAILAHREELLALKHQIEN